VKCLRADVMNVVGSGSEELVFVRFVKSRTCYDVMPYSSKLVVFDTQLKVSCSVSNILSSPSYSWRDTLLIYAGKLL